MGAITATPLIGGIAHFDDVIAVFRCFNGEDRLLLEKGRTVGGSNLKTIFVQDRHIRIDRDVLVNIVDAQTFNLNGDTIPLLHRNLVIVGFLGLCFPLDRDIHRDLLRLGEVIIGLHFRDVRELRNPEVPGVADPAAAADSQMMLPKATVRCDHESDVHFLIINDLEVFRGDSGVMKNHFFRIRKTTTENADRNLRTCLPTPGNRSIEVGRSSFDKRPREGK